MNIEKHLILIKGEDKTEDISHCILENDRWQVTFGKGKTYSYNNSNVQWLKDPITHSGETIVVYHNNFPVSGVDKIFDFGAYKRICYVTGYKKVFQKHEITIERSCLNNQKASNNFDYLKQLADKVSVTNEENSSFLRNQYEKITFISPSSVLSKYLNPTKLHGHQHGQMPLFPFGFNLSQKSAVEKAFTEQVSVIEGPPGTGKTQTILNIIAHAVMNNKTVAVVSNNNAATANVMEKLQKYGVGFFASYLGNKENKEKFFNGQTQTYPDFFTWKMGAVSFDALKKKTQEDGNNLIVMLEAKNEVAILKQKLAALLVEKRYFNTYYNEIHKDISPYRSLYEHNSDTVMALWQNYQRVAENGNGIRLAYKIKNLFRYGIYSFSFYRNSTDKVIAFFQKQFYQLREKELNEKIQKLTDRLGRNLFDSAIKTYSDDSMRLFKAKLAERFPHDKKRKNFTKESLWKDFDSFIKEYPVILSTTHSLRSCTSANFLFDYVVMDEASQIDIVSGALALNCAKNTIIVGDLKQLPNVVPRETAQATNRIFNNYNLNMAYNYAENCMLSSITKLYSDIPKTLLREHYRCHPKIIGFCNQKFYENELIVLTDENMHDKPMVVYKTAKGNHARGNYNQRQIDVIREEILPEQKINGRNQSVGIISPYRMQTDKLKAALENAEVEVETVHKYQGREKKIIILSTVVNEINEFVDNPNLLNVAISRAEEQLIVVISDNEKNRNSNIGDLVRYIDYNNFEVINSNIYSVFDLLYNTYSERLLALVKSPKKVSGYKSENLMNAVIEKVISLPEFQNLGRLMHQPLKMLIRNPEKLDEDECQFAMNVLTHTDFVIFNKLDKMPVLVVEVDGYAFHANNPRQLERDKMKDRILEKYGIPILRIATNESGEEKRLHSKLVQILKPGEQIAA